MAVNTWLLGTIWRSSEQCLPTLLTFLVAGETCLAGHCLISGTVTTVRTSVWKYGVRQTVTTNSVQLPSELSSRTILLLGSIREEVRRYWVVSRSSVLKVSWQTVKFSEGSFWEWLLWFWFYRTEPEQFFRLLLFGFVEVVTQRANGVCGISSRAQSLVGWI